MDTKSETKMPIHSNWNCIKKMEWENHVKRIRVKWDVTLIVSF